MSNRAIKVGDVVRWRAGDEYLIASLRPPRGIFVGPPDNMWRDLIIGQEYSILPLISREFGGDYTIIDPPEMDFDLWVQYTRLNNTIQESA